MIAVIIAYILAIISIPMDILAVDQNDTIKVEEYLNYNIGYLKSAMMYKNKSIIQYIERVTDAELYDKLLKEFSRWLREKEVN